MNLLRKFFEPRAKTIVLAPPVGGACILCGTSIEPLAKKGTCKGCGSTPRLRSLSVLLPSALNRDRITAHQPLLAFSAPRQEKGLLAPYFPEIASVSLHGVYGGVHTRGVDARDLSRYVGGSFGGHYSCLLFDYFVEHEPALAEAYRVLTPGGVFLTHILHTRLREGDLPPTQRHVIQPKPGYYQYIPEDQPMISARVGAAWFLRAMARTGFRCIRFRVRDPAGVVCDWFLGHKD